MAKSAWAMHGTTKCERAVLQSFEFWWPKATVIRDGHVWLIKPADEWQQSAVLSTYQPRTIWKAIRTLRDRGLLVTERHFHPFRNCKSPVLWIRPGHSLVTSSVTPKGDLMSLPSDPQCHSTDSETTVGITEETAASAAAEKTKTEKQEATLQQEKGEPTMGDSQDDHDKVGKGPKAYIGKGVSVMAQKKASASLMEGLALGKALSKPKDQSDFGNLTKPIHVHNAMVAAYRGTYGMCPYSFNQVRGAMLNKFLERLRGEGFSDKDVVALIFRVTGEWGSFVTWAKDKFAINVKGERPNHHDFCKLALEMGAYFRETSQSGGAVKSSVAINGTNANGPVDPFAPAALKPGSQAQPKEKLDQQPADWLNGSFGGTGFGGGA